MNTEDRRRLRPIIRRIQTDDLNIKLQNQFACVYDDIETINEPDVRMSMSDYRTLCSLSGCPDTLTIRILPHRKSVKEFVNEEEEREYKC